ncbi:hypothetical protein [Kiloniella sp. b19]|uniref:hypothetical protein n=1 Tax=Kiloniella sp. GXU_MW_B19 TaxID=3141326 RepID=UPI0031DB4B8F
MTDKTDQSGQEESLLEGLEEELQEFGADDLIVFGVRYDDDDELELAIWDSLDDPALLADMLEDYLESYRDEHGLNAPQPNRPAGGSRGGKPFGKPRGKPSGRPSGSGKKND